MEQNRFIHRDLAARNILLTSKMVAKVGDFGLTKSLVETENYYYSKGEPEKLPIRFVFCRYARF